MVIVGLTVGIALMVIRIPLTDYMRGKFYENK